MTKILLIAVGVIIILFTGYFGLAFVLRQVDKAPPSSNQNETQQTADTTQGSADQNLIGTWETDCLVPVIDNKWAEKHQFVIKENKATHTRWSDDSGANNCNKPNMTLVNKYTYTIPASSQINFNDIENGVTFFDMYKVGGSTLEFGHGFRNDYTGANKISGETEANRIDTLNTYLIYKRK